MQRQKAATVDASFSVKSICRVLHGPSLLSIMGLVMEKLFELLQLAWYDNIKEFTQ